jgi:hypothetical protein
VIGVTRRNDNWASLNWTTSFLAEPGYRAADARICADPIDMADLPKTAAAPQVTYFIADGRERRRGRSQGRRASRARHPPKTSSV